MKFCKCLKTWFKKCWTLDKDDNPHSLSTWWSPIGVGLSLLIFYLIYLNFVSTPTGILLSEEVNNPKAFIGERAHVWLQNLEALGPRVTGSETNEIKTVKYLVDSIEEIIRIKHPSNKIEYDVQRASSGFRITGTTSMYQGLQNVVVRCSPTNGSDPEFAILLNAHFDNVPNSPGGGDNGSMTAVLMEILRAIAKSENIFRHAIVFLFNGSEENTLQGAHAFITLHMWTKNIRAFINIDSAGRGKEIMFQAGPKHPWLMSYYQKAASHPYATAMGEELFQSGLIPSDTDFRIFRDFGNIPGYDFAFATGGYTYHTKYDSVKTISVGSLQHTGDNILELTRELANAEELTDLNANAEGRIVFYDFLGLFLVHYTETVGIVLNIVFALLALATIAFSVYRMAQHDDISVLDACKEYGLILIIHAITLGVAIGIVFLLAIIYDAAGRSMSWFAQPWLTYGIYFCPFYLIYGLGPILYHQFRNPPINLSHSVQLFLHAQAFFYILLLIVLTSLNIRSAFLLMIIVFFYMITTFINAISRLQDKAGYWVIIHVIGQIIPFIFYSSLTLTAFGTLIPITGRSSPLSNPEMTIGPFCFLMALLLGGLLVPLFGLCRCNKAALSIFGILAIIAYIIMATPVGFPFREETEPQRIMAFHVERTLRDNQNFMRKMSSGYLVRPIDHYHFSMYGQDSEYVPSLSNSTTLEVECTNELFCAMPFFFGSYYNIANYFQWIEADDVDINYENRPVLTLHSKELQTSNITRYNFSITGPDHMGLYISPLENSKLVSWSFLDEIYPGSQTWNSRYLYFVNFVYGIHNSEYFFTLDVETFYNDVNIEIALAGQYVHENQNRTINYQNFMDSFPKWTVFYAWVSTYENWMY